MAYLFAQREVEGRRAFAPSRSNEYKWTSRIRSAAKPHGIECAKIEFRSI
jgi:hypothetical protein